MTLHEFHHDSRVRCLAWSGETNLAEVPRCLKFAAAGADHCVRVYVHTGPTDGGQLEVSATEQRENPVGTGTC